MTTGKDTVELALLHAIQQDVKEILHQQELGQVLVREVADQRMAEAFEGSDKLANILVYLHATEMNQSAMAPTLNRRFAKYGAKLTQPRISGILDMLRKKGFLTPSTKPTYATGWGKFLLATYLRRELPPELRPKLKSRLDHLRHV